MAKLRLFNSRPSKFKNIVPIPTKNVKIIHIDKERDPKNGIIMGIFKVIGSNHRNVYDCKIGIVSNEFNLDSDIKFYCSCDSFKYQFAGLLKQRDSLLDEEEFSDSLPKKNAIPYICKHLEACLIVMKQRLS